MAERHPFAPADYELLPAGEVRVVQGELEGVFDWQGRWLRGPLRTADAQMCIWIAGWNGWRADVLDGDLTTATTRRSGA